MPNCRQGITKPCGRACIRVDKVCRSNTKATHPGHASSVVGGASVVSTVSSLGETATCADCATPLRKGVSRKIPKVVEVYDDEKPEKPKPKPKKKSTKSKSCSVCG